ncbi:cytochrome c oxidase subunit I [Mycobacterium sp. 852002-51961_SCH5331710]|uniref:cytochrome c oxidase subunit I n=1 Tax=Mycobacterium sp. 852002-51961_SCH5331710 TaxID=1834105 RepID=UPI0007FFFF6A|nr:cytochrome c oxidase subunit I [Mycobacterium sp. 852002-51961_SCH5331710]OBB35709.1 cytochrome c oxidase subunit I [Mycobacterium sp. 852002-51961_SCH5331710]
MTATPLTERTRGRDSLDERLEKYWSEEPTFRTWFTTVDHKRIGRRYLVTASAFFLISGSLAFTMRAQLTRPEEELVPPQWFNQFFSLHGTTMIFFFATPMLFGFGNLLVPLMLGTRDMAFPRLNAFGYWVFLFSGVFMFSSLMFGNAPAGGWFNYVPLTTEPYSPGLGIDVYSLGLLFLGISTTAGAINFIVTALKMRAPGMSMNRVPIFVWTLVATSMMVIFALPPLNLANAMLFLDRRFGAHFFDPDTGGDVLLWQHLFWLFGHPDVYIIVMPALGIVSAIIPVFSRRALVGYPLIVLSTVTIGIVSFGVWVHHMFATGLPRLSLSFFSAASVLITIPSGIQIFAWLSTMYLGRVWLRAPMLFALGFIVTFVVGGVTGVMFALVAYDQQITDSYFVVAHFHYVLFGGAVFPIMAGLLHWMPKIAGRMYHEGAAVTAFWLVFIGMNLTFFPMHMSGLEGMPRRIYTYRPHLGWDLWNLLSSIGAAVLAIGLALLLGVLLHAMRYGRPAPPDPWNGDTLEWATASPPDHYNFAVIPRVYSLHPMWDERTAASVAEPEPERVLDGSRMTSTSTELDGKYHEAIEVVEESMRPFFVAVGLLAGFVGLLIGWYWVAGVGAAIVFVTLAGWLWPPERSPQEAGVSGGLT